jgi:hypothetical protein
MSAAVVAAQFLTPALGETLWDRVLTLSLPLAVAGVMFVLAARLLRCPELRHMLALRSARAS